MTIAEPEPESSHSTDVSNRTFYICLAAIFLAALTLRMVHLYQIRPIPLFYELLGDAESYDQWAQRIAGGQWVGRDVFYQAPLYPYFLGVVYQLLGHNLLAARIVQCIIGAGACVLLALAGREFFSRRAGVIAGFVLAIYPAAIFFDGVIQKSVLDLALMCAMLYLAGATLNRTSAARWIGLGATLGALMLTRENAAVLVAVILVWIALHPAVSPRTARIKAIALVLIATAAIVLPVAVRNAVISGEVHITTSQLGPNLYIGNNPTASGAYVPLVYGRASPKHERADATALAERAVGRKLSPGEVSRFWLGQVRGFITEHPGPWLELMRTKLFLFWNSTELGDTEDQYVYADWSKVLRVLNPVLHFGILTAAAAVGVIVTLQNWRRLWLLYAVAFFYAAGVIAFYVMARYRYPIVPVLVLFAAAAIVELYDWIRRRRTIDGAILFVCAISVIGVLWATRPINDNMVRAATYQNIAHVLDRSNKLDEASTYYLRARELWPSDPLVHVMLGRVRLDQGNHAEAIGYFEQAVRISPEYAPARVAYGAGLLVAGRVDEARQQFERALEIDPNNEKAQEGMRQVRARRGGEKFSF